MVAYGAITQIENSYPALKSLRHSIGLSPSLSLGCHFVALRIRMYSISAYGRLSGSDGFLAKAEEAFSLNAIRSQF